MKAREKSGHESQSNQRLLVWAAINSWGGREMKINPKAASAAQEIHNKVVLWEDNVLRSKYQEACWINGMLPLQCEVHAKDAVM